jgi:hypothetical protein
MAAEHVTAMLERLPFDLPGTRLENALAVAARLH